MTKVDYELLKKAHEQLGWSLTKMSKMAGVSRQAIYAKFDREGWERVNQGADLPAGKKLSDKQRQVVRDLATRYEVPPARIALLLGVAYSTIWRITGSRGEKSILTRKQQLAIREAHSQGLSQALIAAIAGVSQATVSNLTRREVI